MTPEELKAMRSARGWTQKNISAELGVTTQTIMNWEHGRAPIHKMAALAVERVFNQSRECQCAPARLLAEIRKMVST